MIAARTAISPYEAGHGYTSEYAIATSRERLKSANGLLKVQDKLR